MRHLLLLSLCTLIYLQSNAQGIGIGTTTPHSSAVLDLSSSSQGLLLPRMSNIEMGSIISPANGLVVYNTTENRPYYYDGFLALWTPVEGFYVEPERIVDSDEDTHVTAVDTGSNDFIKVQIESTELLQMIRNTGGDLIFDLSSTSAFFGNEAGRSNTASYNSFFGGLAGENNTTGSSNTFIGSYAGRNNTTGLQNTFAGDDAGSNNTTGNNNVALGDNALQLNNSGSSNVGLGKSALALNTQGHSNVAIGRDALYFNDLSNLVAVGDSALYNNRSGIESYHGTRNTAVGSKALYSNNDGSWNTGLGFQALYNNTVGEDNVGIGIQVLYSSFNGHRNVAVGTLAGRSQTTGDNNVMIGQRANEYNQAGSNNVMIGFEAGQGTSVHDKHNNVFIGHQAGKFETGSNLLYIDNSSTTDPLLYGSFISNELTIHGELGINTKNPLAGLHIQDDDLIMKDGTIDAVKLSHHGFGSGGELELYDTDGTRTVHLLAAQSASLGAELDLYNQSGVLKISLDTDHNGDARITTDEILINGGSDFAEHFNVTADGLVEPGILLSVDPANPGQLAITTEPYDTKLAGVVSGANGIKPGVYMGQKGTIANGETPVALSGRVYVLATAENGTIKAGDLLTSSALPGHAMRATKKRRSQGAIIGKALTALDKGTGYVLVLISLQ